jgi:dTDP-4-dehydrorhamnose reductase
MLITGASGLLGTKLVKLAREFYEVVPSTYTHRFFPDSIGMNVTNAAEVFRAISNYKPEVVVHIAAQTNVDKCESHREEAWKVNAEGTKNVAEACAKVNAKLVYISTDYVFNGEKGLYVEEDPPNPINYYGLTKLKGEDFVREYCQDYVILRSSVLYGWHPINPNFATWVIGSLREGKRISVVDDHYNSPTLASNLAEAIIKAIERNAHGTYHAAGSERVSRYDFAVKIAEIFNLNKELIKPIKMGELTVWVAKRPRDSSLCVDKIQKELSVKLLNINQGLAKMKEEA